MGLRCISEKCSSRAAESSGFFSCGLYPFARQAAHARCRSDSCSVKSTSSPFGPRTKNLSVLSPRVLAVPGLDARAKKRQELLRLVFRFRNVPRQKNGELPRAGAKKSSLIHKPPKSSYLIRKSIYCARLLRLVRLARLNERCIINICFMPQNQNSKCTNCGALLDNLTRCRQQQHRDNLCPKRKFDVTAVTSQCDSTTTSTASLDRNVGPEFYQTTYEHLLTDKPLDNDEAGDEEEDNRDADVGDHRDDELLAKLLDPERNQPRGFGSKAEDPCTHQAKPPPRERRCPRGTPRRARRRSSIARQRSSIARQRLSIARQSRSRLGWSSSAPTRWETAAANTSRAVQTRRRRPGRYHDPS